MDPGLTPSPLRSRPSGGTGLQQGGGEGGQEAVPTCYLAPLFWGTGGTILAPRVCFKQTSVTSRRDLPGVCVTQTLIKTQDAAVRVSCFLPGGLSAWSLGAAVRARVGPEVAPLGGVMPKRHGLPEPCLRAQGSDPFVEPRVSARGPPPACALPPAAVRQVLGARPPASAPEAPHHGHKRCRNVTAGGRPSAVAVGALALRGPGRRFPALSAVAQPFPRSGLQQDFACRGGAAVCDPECVRFPRAAPSQILARCCRGPQPHFEPGVRTERSPAAGDLPGRGGGQGVIVTSPSSLFLGD